MHQNKGRPSLDEECFLISEDVISDGIGNEVETEEAEESIYCAEIPTVQSEFYAAAKQDIKVEKVLIINSIDYTNQEKVRHKNDLFEVYRTFPREGELIELYLRKD